MREFTNLTEKSRPFVGISIEIFEHGHPPHQDALLMVATLSRYLISGHCPKGQYPSASASAPAISPLVVLMPVVSIAPGGAPAQERYGCRFGTGKRRHAIV